jgi:AcrR family transcriptional regulator
VTDSEPPGARSVRERPARAALSREAIVEAGLRILQQDGMEAVTMRRVAAELDTGAASLYVYVANRDAMLDAMLDHVIGEMRLPPVEPGRWREQLVAAGVEIVTVMDRYPGIARVAIGNVPMGERALASIEWMLAVLRGGGLHDQTVAWGTDVFALYTTAAAFENSVRRAAGGALDPSEVEAYIAALRLRLGSLPPDRFPNIVAMVGPLTSGGEDGGRDRFVFGLEVLADGLWAHSERLKQREAAAAQRTTKRSR